jgi:hypothetical protein
MQNMNGNKQFSATLNNSIVSAFKNAQAAGAAVNAATQAPELEPEVTPIVKAATNSLENLEKNLKREVKNANNLNTIMTKITSNPYNNTNNKKAEAYIQKRGSNKLDANSQLNSGRGSPAQWTTVLNAARQKIPPPLPKRKNELLAQAAAPEKNYTQMSTQNLLKESIKNNLSNSNKRRLIEALQDERMRLGGLNNDTLKKNSPLIQGAINRLKPKPITVGNRLVGGIARGFRSAVSGAGRVFTGKPPPNSK